MVLCWSRGDKDDVQAGFSSWQVGGRACGCARGATLFFGVLRSVDGGKDDYLEAGGRRTTAEGGGAGARERAGKGGEGDCGRRRVG